MNPWVRLASAALLVAACLGGCGTTAEEERREAALHDYYAQRAADAGDYQTAAREQRAAWKARRQQANKALAHDQFPAETPPAPPPVPPAQ
jgi:hypothetical protein